MNTCFIRWSLVSVVLFSSCDYGLDKEPGTYKNDFEATAFWGNPARVTHDISRSGRYSTYTVRNQEFSETFVLPVSGMVKQPGVIKASAWMLSHTLDARATLVISVESGGKSLIWQGLEIQKLLTKVDTWTEINVEVKVPGNLPEDAIIKVYGWNNGEHIVYWDDFLIRVE